MPETSVRQIRVMISSTREDLDQYRKEAARIIRKVAQEREKQVQLVEISMEKEPQSGNRETAVEVSKRWVEESDWIIVIVGWNYGTISDEPGDEGLSITEWEFRYASELGKKLFVFVSGSPGTADRYRVSEEEIEDLKDWIPRQNSEQAEKIEAFRQKLCKRAAGLFANLQAFREKLETTLRNAIDDLPPEIQPGTPLAELVVSVMPDIRECIRKVTLIANCKTIHDRLHEILQHVVRPLREEVIAVWEQEGEIGKQRQAVMFSCLFKASRYLGEIEGEKKLVAASQQALFDSLEEVVGWISAWEAEITDKSNTDRETFTELVDRFAYDIQEAFSEADRSMISEESNLREDYHVLLEGLRKARKQKNLSEAEQQHLDEDLSKLESNRERIKNTLTTHHCWQEAHDKLEEVESFRDSEYFEKKLGYYLGIPMKKLQGLIDRELERLDKEESDEQDRFEEEKGAFREDLLSLQANMAILQKERSSAAFEDVIKPFDNTFYIVDKRALAELERARVRVARLEEWLDDLARAQNRLA